MFACILLFLIPKRHLSLLQREGRDEKRAIKQTNVCDKIKIRGGSLAWTSSEQSPSRETKKNYPQPINETTIERSVCGPRALIIGAMKCGTNSIGQILRKHPRIKLHTCNRINDKLCDAKHFQGSTKGHFWEMNGFTNLYNQFQANDVWIELYAQMLPSDEKEGVPDIMKDRIKVDKSPTYLNTDLYPGVELRAHKLLPHAKIIVTLCDPAGRLYSHYHHMKRVINEKFEEFYHDWSVPVPSNFSEFVALFVDNSELCQKQPAFCDLHRKMYLSLGEYHRHLDKWREAFGEKNILVLNMLEDQLVQTHRILEHIGSDVLPKTEYPWEKEKEVKAYYVNPTYSGRASGYKEHANAMQWASEHYKPHNLILAEAIGQSWPLKWSLDV